ncbi:uncharacterized protein ASCRUDRAFT_68183 [Ascoidea rubescens DSM 1968]|uniref:U6 small nuclear RNA (adenine-(43)-N(6))-methyltransferase n=1 Tax=Ascoidea rubescens DSM 1968 TaxID=1344418 RepID=A0A1D2VRG5_9ASCO|nr:hypothetical protein ASCRUDRAFT_68183 [Ascoidea rubescens DSM 1968]ODV64165.1 hypothetical protein ASCRUDRAFT_68183 [Ascoidea rubescens DSM 1968]
MSVILQLNSELNLNSQNVVEFNYKLINFKELSIEYPSLKSFFADYEENIYNFNDQNSLIELSKILLKKFFSINISLSLNFLIPRIPIRFLYVKYINEILFSYHFDNVSSLFLADSTGTEKTETVGIDIGTGSSLIYPLLFISAYNNHNNHNNNSEDDYKLDYKIIATEINNYSFEFAMDNLKSNKHLGSNLEDKINIVKISKNDDPLIDFDKFKLIKNINNIENIKFLMCNPPFYSNNYSISRFNNTNIDNKEETLKKTIGLKSELYYKENGELDFIQKLIKESLVHKNKICWYTCLISKFKLISNVILIIKENNISNYLIHELNPSNDFYNQNSPISNDNKSYNRGKRFVLLWSFNYIRLPNYLSSNNKLILKKYCSNNNEFKVDLKSFIKDDPIEKNNMELIKNCLISGLDYSNVKDLKLNNIFDSFIIKFDENVWSRSYKRRLKFNKINENDNMKKKRKVINEDEIIIIQIIYDHLNSHLYLFWKYGKYYKTFESFTGYTLRQLNNLIEK